MNLQEYEQHAHRQVYEFKEPSKRTSLGLYIIIPFATGAGVGIILYAFMKLVILYTF